MAAAVYPQTGAFELRPDGGALRPANTPARKWTRHWVVQDSVLNNGKCVLLKWVNADSAKGMQLASQPKGLETGSPGPSASRGQGTIFVCSIDGCGKVFMDAGALRKHSHVHGERQYICHYEGCGKRFVDSSKLKRHFLIHTGEKHFICPFEGCGKAFSLDFNRRSHMRTHTGENYHTCPVMDCGKRFAHENKLRAHMLAAHTEKETKDAGIDQEREDEPGDVKVEDALIEADSDRPFLCPHEACGKRYIHEYKLNLHLKKEHSMGVEHSDRKEGGGGGGGGGLTPSDSEGDDRENTPLSQSGGREAIEGETRDDERRGQKRKNGKSREEDEEKKRRKSIAPKEQSKALSGADQRKGDFERMERQVEKSVEGNNLERDLSSREDLSAEFGVDRDN